MYVICFAGYIEACACRPVHPRVLDNFDPVARHLGKQPQSFCSSEKTKMYI